MSDVPALPASAPEWMSPLVRGLDASSDQLRRLLGRRVPQKDTAAEAAVLMLLSGDPGAKDLPGDARVLLTHRTPTMRSHSGQMAFPGGRIDPGDAGPVDAALREAWEETGLERARVAPLATLDTVTTGGSGRAVAPVLAYSADPGETRVASVQETDDVFFASLADLIEPANRVQVGMLAWHGPAFWVNDYLVWGFTGALLDALLRAGSWAKPWESGRIVPLRSALKRSRNGERHFS
ncbi:putative NUDIX hydrolase [Corynebacterium capitovis DSM 44611]|uniref:NUDIX hydrolase n=1 Tax=Corynebacterium capitovis TaxID=131081 RepID=UPI000380F1A9|nr:CoA pyrophosphatase [Corynebacterium capitovis]WKD56719.1 putative NUDIX hydrolase [Corynebacterium capitovis DSM 44611]